MKTKISMLASAILCVGLFTACNGLFTGEKAPNAIEKQLFNTTTNYVTKTNEVVLTNSVTIPKIVTVTNELNQVVTVTNTFQQVILVTNEIPVQVPVYSLVPSQSTASGAQTAGSIMNTVIPGSGGLVAGGLLALASIWGRLRSSKQTSIGLSQEVESMLEFVNALPNGTAYTEAIKKWLRDHQVESGIAEQVLDIVENHVDNTEARSAVSEIKNTIQAAQVAAAPKPPA